MPEDTVLEDRITELEAEVASVAHGKDQVVDKLSATLVKLEAAELAVATGETNAKDLATAFGDMADERDRAVAEADEHRPTRDVMPFLMETADDVRKRFTPQNLEDLANAELVTINRERTKNGHWPLPALEGIELEKAIDEAIASLLADRAMATPPTEGPLGRSLKMVSPAKGGQPEQLRQIPYEPQINNMAGSLEDGFARYRRKGFKMADPSLCPTMDCSLKSVVGEDGEFVYGAYCSADHRIRTERDSSQSEIPGVTSRNVVRGRVAG